MHHDENVPYLFLYRSYKHCENLIRIQQETRADRWHIPLRENHSMALEERLFFVRGAIESIDGSMACLTVREDELLARLFEEEKKELTLYLRLEANGKARFRLYWKGAALPQKTVCKVLLNEPEAATRLLLEQVRHICVLIQLDLICLEADDAFGDTVCRLLICRLSELEHTMTVHYVDSRHGLCLSEQQLLVAENKKFLKKSRQNKKNLDKSGEKLYNIVIK